MTCALGYDSVYVCQSIGEACERCVANGWWTIWTLAVICCIFLMLLGLIKIINIINKK
jgi:hypothetical protein